MKKDKLKTVIYSARLVDEIKIPITSDIAKVIINTDNCDVVYDSYASYQKTDSYVYDENMRKLFSFQLKYIKEDKVK